MFCLKKIILPLKTRASSHSRLFSPPACVSTDVWWCWTIAPQRMARTNDGAVYIFSLSASIQSVDGRTDFGNCLSFTANLVIGMTVPEW